jgi:7-cyano-7-deazaguanine reductase
MPRRRATPRSLGPGPVECFANPQPDRDYEVRIVAREFTSVCPRTGQPDFGVLTITYVPDQLCLELKSLKLYLQGYRNRGIFYEAAANAILNDLVASCRPRRLTVLGEFNARGGLTTSLCVSYPTRTRKARGRK